MAFRPKHGGKRIPRIQIKVRTLLFEGASKVCQDMQTECPKLEVYASFSHRCDVSAGLYTSCGPGERRLAFIACSAGHRDRRSRVTRGAHPPRRRWTAKLFALPQLVSQLRYLSPRRRAADQKDPLDCAQLPRRQRGGKAASAVGEGEIQNRRLG